MQFPKSHNVSTRVYYSNLTSCYQGCCVSAPEKEVHATRATPVRISFKTDRHTQHFSVFMCSVRGKFHARIRIRKALARLVATTCHGPPTRQSLTGTRTARMRPCAIERAGVQTGQPKEASCIRPSRTAATPGRWPKPSSEQITHPH